MKKIVLFVGLCFGIILQVKAQETDPIWKAAEAAQLMYRGQLTLSADLNTYIENGFWHTGAGGSSQDPNGAHGAEWQNAVAVLHWPPQSAAGILTVERLGELNWCIQTYRVTSYSGNGRFWYRSNWNGAWSPWYEVSSTLWAETNFIKNDTTLQQGSFNLAGTGRLEGYFYFGNSTKIGSPSASYLAVLTPESKAQNIKVGGITVSDRYSDNAPLNGIFVKGNSNFVGNVGIGIINPEDKLAVAGTVRAKEIYVQVSDWPDYVFRADYKITPLEVLKRQIMGSGHLPELPTSKQVDREGIPVGELNKKLVKKIEELTLYVIRQQEDIKKQEAMIRQQSIMLQNQSQRLKLLEFTMKSTKQKVTDK